MLTKRQNDLLSFIANYLAVNQISPSFDEMAAAMGLSAKSGIHRALASLEERGCISRMKNRARGITILRMPPGAEHSLRRPTVDDFVAVRLLGKIAAGNPIEAVNENAKFIKVDKCFVGSGPHFALEVCGDSMNGDGILNGDIVLIRQTEQPENGQIVAALIDGNEVTLKRLRILSNSIALEPSNASFKTRYFRNGDIKIQGVVAALIRRL